MSWSFVESGRRTAGGIWAAIRVRRALFAAVTVGVFALDLILPPLVLSMTRKPLDFFTFNPWLSQLPAYLLASQIPLESRLAFLLRVALFWFSADSPYGGVEWGYAVDATDLARFVFGSLVVAAYFVLWLYRRDRIGDPGIAVRISRHGGVVGALVSVLGLSTGPCSVMGCGAPVIPVLGLAFAGLSSGTLSLLAEFSKIGTTFVLAALDIAA